MNKLKFEHKTKEVNKLGWIWMMYFVIAWSIFTRKVVVYFLKIENDSTTLLLNFQNNDFFLGCLQKKRSTKKRERSESKANENFLKKGGWLVSGGFIWVNHGKNDVDLSGAPHTLRVAWCASIFLWIVIFTKKK